MGRRRFSRRGSSGIEPDRDLTGDHVLHVRAPLKYCLRSKNKAPTPLAPKHLEISSLLSRSLSTPAFHVHSGFQRLDYVLSIWPYLPRTWKSEGFIPISLFARERSAV